MTDATSLGSTLDVADIATFNGGVLIPSGQILTASGAAVFTPGNNNNVTINTNPANNSFLTINGLATETGNALCVDASNNVAECNGAPFGLQAAYNTGNTITTTNGRNIAFNLYDQSTDSGTATSFDLTNEGSAPAFIINGANATPTQTALEIENNGSPAFTVDEKGDLVTSGTIATTNTTASTNSSTGALTVTGGVGIGGVLNVGSTLGVTGNTTIGGTLGVTGNTSLSTVATSALATINSLLVTNNATVSGALAVTGATALSGDLTVSGNTNTQ